jgi:hypothetical protein
VARGLGAVRPLGVSRLQDAPIFSIEVSRDIDGRGVPQRRLPGCEKFQPLGFCALTKALMNFPSILGARVDVSRPLAARKSLASSIL